MSLPGRLQFNTLPRAARSGLVQILQQRIFCSAAVQSPWTTCQHAFILGIISHILNRGKQVSGTAPPDSRSRANLEKIQPGFGPYRARPDGSRFNAKPGARSAANQYLVNDRKTRLTVESALIRPHIAPSENMHRRVKMITGIVLILAGVLLVLYPPLLSIIVAAFLVFAGVMAISVARYNRLHRRHFDNPTVEFFFRY
jgi:hypothetical protein